MLIELGESLADRIQAECLLAASLYIKLGGRKVNVLIKDPLNQCCLFISGLTQRDRFMTTAQGSQFVVGKLVRITAKEVRYLERTAERLCG